MPNYQNQVDDAEGGKCAKPEDNFQYQASS